MPALRSDIAFDIALQMHGFPGHPQLLPTAVQVASPLLSHQHRTFPYNQLNHAVDFETPLFKGKLLVLFKGLPNTPKAVFAGKKRLMWLTIQGQFKQEVPVDSLMIGSEFSRPLKLPASALIIRATQWLINKLGSGVQLNPVGDKPHILAPLITAAQIVNVSLPGQQPDLLTAEEDMTSHDSCLVSGWAGNPMSAARRRSYFANKGNRQGRFYDTEHVWTFQLYDQSLDYSTFALPIPLFKLDLVQVLDGQPMQLMLQDTSSGTDMMRFEVWHKRMLEHKANSASNPTSSMSTGLKSANKCAAREERVISSMPMSWSISSLSSSDSCSSCSSTC
eukprot:GHUV01024650.1.p2 GENE.GHUV01024650.1~~GHUV01024650.1.p2  ORF type:complete len:334 (+),score=107.30 GHUV01024650.1:4074-5075(+)